MYRLESKQQGCLECVAVFRRSLKWLNLIKCDNTSFGRNKSCRWPKVKYTLFYKWFDIYLLLSLGVALKTETL